MTRLESALPDGMAVQMSLRAPLRPLALQSLKTAEAQSSAETNLHL